MGRFAWPDLAGTSAETLTFWRERREPQMEVREAGKNGRCVGAAQGNLAGTEIVEQGACALHVRKVELSSCLSLGAGCHFAATEWYDRRVS
jgi:hypothetical protein